MFLTIFIYSRVSHKSSADSGLSIASQREECERYVSTVITGNEETSEPIIHKCDNGVSAYKKSFVKRPASREIYEQAKPGDHIVCYSVNRFSRTLRDFLITTDHFAAMGVHLHFVTDGVNTSTATGKMMMHMLATMAQFTSDLISERTREALAIKAEREGSNLTVNKLRKPKLKWVGNPELAEDIQEEKPNRRGGTIFRYQRVSTGKQFESGLGLEHQEKANTLAAERIASETGGKVHPEVFSDNAVSAFKTPFFERPAVKRMMELAKPGDDIVIFRVDRFSRHPGDSLQVVQELQNRGIYLHLVNEGIRTDTGRGEEWIGMLSAIAHMESSMRSRRVREAFKHCRANGRPVSSPRKGWAITVVNNTKKLTFDRDSASQCVMVWLLRKVYGFTPKQVEETIHSFECERRGKFSLAYKVKGHTERQLLQAETIREKLTKEAWESLLEYASQKYIRPLDDKYRKLSKWEWPFNSGVETLVK